jgi:uncharacterized protein GlcG (DUF336 family)
MAGTGDDVAGGGDDVGGDDDIGGGVVGAGGNAAAVVGLDEALPSGLRVATTKAKAAVYSAMTPMSATGSHLLADFALTGAAGACGALLERPSSHVATT